MPELISVNPPELTFRFELRKQLSCTVRLTNVTNEVVAFKVKTTAPKKYCVRPNAGLIQPESYCDITFTMQSQKEEPLDLQCKDKFLVQSIVVPAGATLSTLQPEMFNKDENKSASETKLRVVYVRTEPVSDRVGPAFGVESVIETLSARAPQRSSKFGVPLVFVILIALIAILAGYYFTRER